MSENDDWPPKAKDVNEDFKNAHADEKPKSHAPVEKTEEKQEKPPQPELRWEEMHNSMGLGSSSPIYSVQPKIQDLPKEKVASIEAEQSPKVDRESQFIEEALDRAVLKIDRTSSDLSPLAADLEERSIQRALGIASERMEKFNEGSRGRAGSSERDID